MGLDWIGLDLSQNITPPRAPCGAKNGILEDPKTKIICGMPKAKISSFISFCNIYLGFCQVRYEIEKQITKITNRHHAII